MIAELIEEKIVIVREVNDRDNILVDILNALLDAMDFEVISDTEIPFGWYECWGNDYVVYPFEAYFDGSQYAYRLTQTDIGELATGTTGTTVVLDPVERIF